jgi:hypothetical protein
LAQSNLHEIGNTDKRIKEALPFLDAGLFEDHALLVGRRKISFHLSVIQKAWKGTAAKWKAHTLSAMAWSARFYCSSSSWPELPVPKARKGPKVTQVLPARKGPRATPVRRGLRAILRLWGRFARPVNSLQGLVKAGRLSALCPGAQASWMGWVATMGIVVPPEIYAQAGHALEMQLSVTMVILALSIAAVQPTVVYTLISPMVRHAPAARAQRVCVLEQTLLAQMGLRMGVKQA